MHSSSFMIYICHCNVLLQLLEWSYVRCWGFSNVSVTLQLPSSGLMTLGEIWYLFYSSYIRQCILTYDAIHMERLCNIKPCVWIIYIFMLHFNTSVTLSWFSSIASVFKEFWTFQIQVSTIHISKRNVVL
jgi:hypothetical protein